MTMGAIEHEGYRFEIEYSVLLQKGVAACLPQRQIHR